jgi:VCBS repeat-containing protein
VGVILATFILMIGWYVNSRMADDFETGGPVTSESGQYNVKLRIMSQHHAWSTEAAREVHTTGKVSILLLVENKGNTKETFDLKATEHEGWTVTLDKTVLNLAKGQNKVVILTIKSSDATVDDSVNVKVTATAQDDMSALSIVEAKIDVEDLGEVKSIQGDQVSVYYVLVDRGDTASFDENTWSINQHNTFTTEAGGSSGSISGFADGVVGMRVGETKSFLIPADQAYGDKPESESSPVGDLYYEITMEDIV